MEHKSQRKWNNYTVICTFLITLHICIWIAHFTRW